MRKIIHAISKFFVNIGIKAWIMTLMQIIFLPFIIFFLYKGNIRLAGALILIGAMFDLFDGEVARISNTVSKKGALLDSTVDRLFEGGIVIGLYIYLKDLYMGLLLILVLIFSIMISYIRARGEALKIDIRIGIFPRAVRIILWGGWLFFLPYKNLIIYLIVIMLIGVFITTIQRFIYGITKK